MKETGGENPESSDASDSGDVGDTGDSGDAVEARSADGMQEADDETSAREDVRADWAAEVANTVGGDVAEAITPIARNLYENREHWKIQADAALAKLERKFGKKSEE